jgi:hypothetical protein
MRPHRRHERKFGHGPPLICGHECFRRLANACSFEARRQLMQQERGQDAAKGFLHRIAFVAAGAVFVAAKCWSALHRRLAHNCLHRTGTTRTTSLQNRKLEPESIRRERKSSHRAASYAAAHSTGVRRKLVTANLDTACMGSHPRFGGELHMCRPGDRSRALHYTLSTTRQSFRARIITPLLKKDDSNGDKQSANSLPSVRNCACAESTDQPCR